MVDFVLGRLRFKFKGDWAISTAYLRDDVITYGGRSYVCLTNHTSSSSASGGFYSDSARWELMTDGTEWKNNWATSTYYKVNDLIKFGARIFICSNGHTSSATANSGFYSDSANWQLYADGYQNVQTWTPSTYYKVNDIVKFGARLYLANTGHTANSTANSGFYSDGNKWQLLNDGIQNFGTWSTNTYYKINDIVKYGSRIYISTNGHTSNTTSSGGFYSDSSNWQMLSDGVENLGTWATSTYYKVNTIVKFGARTYIATSGHTSSATANSGFYTDLSNWQLLNDGMENRGTWQTGYYYRINDIVKWGADIYICNTGHTAGANWTNTEANFTLLVGGLEFEDSYSSGTLYQPGDIVRYGGYQFVATNETQGNLPTNVTYWSVLSTGFNHEGDYNNGTAYQPGDVVRYGAYTYVAKVDTTGNLPTNATYWDLLNRGSRWLGDYNGATSYVAGDQVRYGSYSYVATQETISNIPTDTTYWSLLNQGTRWLGDYNNGTAYVPGDTVRWGGYTYQAALNTTGQAPHSNTSAWLRQVTGVSWKDAYNPSTTYQLGDVVRSNGSSWISTSNNNIGVTPDTTSNTYWSVLVQGSANNVLSTLGDILYQAPGGLGRLPIGANGQVLSIHSGIPQWEDNSFANNVFYVAENGTDSPSHGKTLQRPFRTIKYATGHTANTVASGSKTTIFVKNGTYEEQLPITVPANTAIMGDAQRTVVVQPAAGNDDSGTKLNTQSTMWRLSDGTLLKQMTFVGMTGFVPASPNNDDITTATIGGVFVAFNPASPISTKSPYVLECSAISNGGVGTIVDGSVHASGNKSMVFHAYTMLNNDGVGYYIKDNGRAEIVSCFTYYCWFGIATSGGGFVRGLNNNNSYGRYGAVSRGFDVNEIPHYGKIYGRQLQFLPGSTMAFNAGEYITGASSSANGIVTNVQAAADKLYYWPISGTFQNSESVTGVTTATSATVTSSGVTGQKGYVIVANGFNDEPMPGRSIQFADDANNAYVIQSVSGTYTDTNSRIVIVLSQEKLNPSSNAANVVIRANFSQIRLTGHDFLDIGTGNTATANVPGTPTLSATQGNEVVEYKPGRVYYVSTDQNGNFRVGEYFRIDQATGRATLDASAFDLAGLTSLKLGSIGAQLGETINEFSSDVTMGGNSNQAVPTEYAVKTYVDTLTKSVMLDDISSGFNGNTRVFTLTSSSANVSIGNPYSLDIKLGDVRVYPTSQTSIIIEDITNYSDFGLSYRWKDGYYLTGTGNNVINFYTAPLRGMTFYAKVTNTETVPNYSFNPTDRTPFSPLNIVFSD